MELTTLSAIEQAKMIRTGQISAAELLEATLERVQAIDGRSGSPDNHAEATEDREKIHAFVTICEEEAQKKAEKDKKRQERDKKLAEQERQKKLEQEKKERERIDAQKKADARRQAREAEVQRQKDEKAKRKEAARQTRLQQEQEKKNAAKQGTKKATSFLQTSSSKLTQSQRNDSIRAAQQKGHKTNQSSVDND